MKKIICILIIMICCVCSTAGGETHIGIQGTVVSENNNNQTLLIDFIRYDDKETLITSTLTPDCVIRVTDEHLNIFSAVNMLFNITPDTIALFTEQIEGIDREWLTTRYTEYSEGIYTGTLLGKASSVCSTEYMLSDLAQFIKNHYKHNAGFGNDEDSNTESCVMLLECFTCLAETLAEKYNPIVRMKRYDNDRYVTYELLKQDQVILTLSIDNTKGNEKRILISHKENNRYYFRDIHAQYGRNEIDLMSGLYCSISPLFENVHQEDMIICEHFTLTEGDLQCSIDYDCENRNKDTILSLKGSVTSEKMDAGISLQDSKKVNIILSAIKDTPRAENTPDTKRVLDENSDSDINEFRMAFMSGLSIFLAEAVPMLPVSSQNMLYQMLFDQ